MDKEKIIKVIEQCYDPEIPVDLWNLGLIYNIDYKLNEKNKYIVNITMTLTTPGCGMADSIANDLRNKLLDLNVISEANIKITFDPPWEAKMMTDKAKDILGLSINKNEENNNWE